MPNAIVDRYRKALAEQGLTDPRTDDFITLDLGRAAEQANRSVFDANPDFASDYDQVREANAPGLLGEAGRALKSGSQELASTALGAGALLTGSDYLKEKARSFQEDAAANAPTISTVEDISPGETNPVKKYLSKDAVRYALAKVGGAAPSLGEGVVLALAGGAAGSALGPEGTLAGAGEGAIEGFLGHGLVKNAIRRLLATQGEEMVAAKLIPEATESAVANAIRSGSPELLDVVKKEASDLAARRGGLAANAANMYGLSAGGLYNETGDREASAIGGAVAALPGIVLPEIVLHKLYPGMAAKVGEQLGTKYVTRLATEALKDAGVMGTAMATQEAANVVVKNIAAGKDPMDFSDEDWKRIREGAIGGVLTGPLAAPFTARGNEATFDPAGAKSRSELARRAAAEHAIAPGSSPAETAAPVTLAPEVISPERRVATMDEGQQKARLAELTAKGGEMTPDEFAEHDLLQAMVGEQTPPPVVGEVQKPPTTAELNQGDGGATLPPDEPVLVQAADATGHSIPAAPVAADEYLYTIQRPQPHPTTGETIPGFVQIDRVANEGRGEPLSEAERAALPQPPAWMPTGQYTSEQVREAISKGAPTDTPAVENQPQLLSSAREGPSAPPPPMAPVGGEIVPAADVPPPIIATPREAIPAPTFEQRLREELTTPPKFTFGRVNEGAGVTVDLRVDPRFESLTPEQASRLPVTNALDDSGNKTKTRVAVVLEAPDGHYVQAGLLTPQELARAGAEGKARGPGVQLFANESRKGGGYEKVIAESGKKPALLQDVIASGYKLRAIVHFDAAPGVIFQRFKNAADYDAAYAGSERTTGRGQKVAPTGTASDGIQRDISARKLGDLQQKIDEAAQRYEAAQDPAQKAELKDEIDFLYEEKSRLESAGQSFTGNASDPRLMTEESAPTPVPIEADRAQQFAIATARLRQAGAKVDVFARSFLQNTLRGELERQIGANPARADALREQLAALDRVRGVTYSPQHIAVGLDDVQHANLADLVTLLHEAGHGILGQDPAMQAKVLRAVDSAMDELRAKLGTTQSKTGVREANLADPEELLVSTIAQKLALEGVPESPSLARAIFQWAKDLYYRLAMSVQSAFGHEADPKLALDWFENQMRRVTGGDYDYRLANLFGKLTPETNTESYGRFQPGESSTPGSLVDFVDPTTDKMRQPSADISTADGVAWNLKFATDAEPVDGNDIPAPEARARTTAAAINEEAELVQKLFTEVAPKGMTVEQFWKIAGRGDMPMLRLGDIAEKFAGAETARIGGERMTDAMNQQARVEAKRLVQKMQWQAIRRIAEGKEKASAAETGLRDQAALVNKIEGDLRNADMHEATMRDKLKEMIRGLSKGMRRGLDTAFAQGELAREVREAEGLAENDAIPEHYQEVFKSILADGLPVFSYVDGIASLDFNLAEMTPAEIRSGIRANAEGNAALARLIEPRNKPLFIALSILAKKNARQVDMIQLRRASQADFLAIHGDLNAIRSASEARLKEMSSAMREQTKAVTLADRIKRGYVEERAKLRRFSNTIKQAEERRGILEKATVLLADKVQEMERSGMTAPSEWKPSDGAKWTAMRQAEDDTWTADERTLRFTPEGPAVDAAQVRNDIAANWQWLKENKDKSGTKLYETVKRQTEEIAHLDVQAQYQEGWVHLLDRMTAPIGERLKLAGHAAGARADQMLKRFQFINFSHWGGDLEDLSYHWTASLRKVEAAAKIKDHGQLFGQIYDPVLYLIQAETGLDEGPALREAVRAARRRLPAEPAENFDEVFKDFLRKTKAVSERVVQIAEQNGLFVKDPRLGGELRRAVAQGWLTVMRRVDASTVATIIRDMDAAGWKLELKDEEGKPVQETFAQAAGGSSPRRIVAATTFDSLMPEKATSPDDEKARVAVLSNPELFSKAISGFFTPGIIGRWLEPFLNKPGEPVFYHGDEPIEQMDVQRAWQDAGGNVARFIDELGKKATLTIDEEAKIPMDPEVAFRADMLRQIDSLFLMESRTAYEASQTKNLFDPMGPKGHIVMDARVNNLIPPEHLQHMAFDPISAKNLLATLAFHSAFGRNGESMTQALDELKGNIAARKQQFESLRGTSKAERKANAAARGLDYKELERAARSFDQVMAAQESLKGQFGFSTQTGALGDLRTGMEVLHFITGQTVNNPKTGLLNLLQLTQRAVARRSLGPSVVKGTVGAGAEFSKQVMGSFLENFGLHLMRASEHAKEIGGVQGQAFGKLPRSVAMSDIGRRGNLQSEPAIKALRKVRDFQRFGVQPGLGEAKEFGKFNVIPGIGGVMNTISQWAAIANGTAEVRSVESLVQKAVSYFAAHPSDAANPAFRLTAKDLGMENRAWFDDSGSFTYFRHKLVEYGVGNIEDVARAAADRKTKGEPLLTSEQAIKVAMMTGNELDLASNINTNPANWANNPVLKFATPLLGWPIRQMNQVHQSMKTAEGRQTVKSTLKALGIMAAWSVPMGLAFTLMTDQYDDKILKKKSALGGVDTVNGALQRLSRAGNIYGLGFDALTQTLTSLDPTSGQRPFSLDSRILAFSQIANLQQAISNWINSGGSATWATVEKPLVLAMGGNGALHALDIFNAALGLDNAESRLVQRTNAQQWLRSAGREAGVEIRASGGASTAPTPVSIWVREMQLAAYANDRADFLDAYRKATDAARERGDDDPEKKVLESWRARNPLEVFRTKPTETELRKIYSAMNDKGQEAVHEALRLYDQYTKLIEPTASEKFMTRMTRSLRPPATTGEQLRRRMATQALGLH